MVVVYCWYYLLQVGGVEDVYGFVLCLTVEHVLMHPHLSEIIIYDSRISKYYIGFSLSVELTL